MQLRLRALLVAGALATMILGFVGPSIQTRLATFEGLGYLD